MTTRKELTAFVRKALKDRRAGEKFNVRNVDGQTTVFWDDGASHTDVSFTVWSAMFDANILDMPVFFVWNGMNYRHCLVPSCQFTDGVIV